MACSNLFDLFRAVTESLGQELYARASWRDLWLNLVPRADYPRGAGYTRSTFEVARSEPATDEEAWTPVQAINTETNPQGACDVTYNQVYLGEKEKQYKPEGYGLMGPLQCQDDFTMYWRTEEFWSKYYRRLEQRNVKSIINRIGNVYRQYSYKAAARDDFSYVVGKHDVQPVPQHVDMTDYTTGSLGLPDSELTQEMLDGTATQLIQEGAAEGDSDGWITMGNDGPVWPLNIGIDISHRLLLNNSALRQDYNASFQGWGDANPVIQRLAAARVIKNFRHVITAFPARWIYVPDGVTINYTSTGMKSNTGTITTYNNTVGAVGNPADTIVPDGTPQLIRIPTFVNSTDSFDVTKGRAGIVNGVWNDPQVTASGTDAALAASFESVEVLNPLTMTEELLMPVNSMPGMKLTPQNYFGEWKFVTGNDAMLGIDGCTGIQDPTHTRGRHFGRYRVAHRPIHVVFGRFILFRRCSAAYSTVTCS